MSEHCMLDLETLSTRADARIISIGAVLFNETDGVTQRFYTVVETPDISRLLEISSVFHVAPHTLEWWSRQPDEARAVFWDPSAVPLHEALVNFAHFIEKHSFIETVKMWGNGASFDNAILAMAYDLMGIERPWKHYNDRCYRTMKKQHSDVKLYRVGTHHNAVDDAESQAAHLLRIFKEAH